MKVNDWRKGIEDSGHFLAIVTPSFFKDALPIEQALYAKELKKPTILLRKEGTKLEIPDLFDNIILEIIYKDEEDFNKREAEIAEKIIKIMQ